MHHSVDIFVMFGLLLAGLCVSTPILQAACALYNKLAEVILDRGSRQTGHADKVQTAEQTLRANRPDGTVKLDALKAFCILFGTAMFNVVLSFLISKTLRALGVKAAVGPLGIMPIARLITLPVSILVLAALLPTSFGKGLFITLLYLLLWLALGGILLALLFVMTLASAGLR